jgi:hypothetical protein
MAVNKNETITPKNSPQNFEFLRDFENYEKKLVNWINERAVPQSTPILDRLKKEVVAIKKERRARKLIVRAISEDVTTNFLKLPWIYEGVLFNQDRKTYLGHGNPDKKAPKVLDELEEVLEQQGSKKDTVTIYIKDTLTNEPHTLVIGKRSYGEGQMAYYSEERRNDKSIISSAIIGVTDKRDFKYRLILNSSDGRFAEKSAEIDIDSEFLPRATIQTLKLSVRAFKQGLKSNT